MIGNKKIDSKNSIIINLLDYESISSQLQMKKGSLLYEYILSEINDFVQETNIEEDIETNLNILLKEVLKQKTIDYELYVNFDLSKLITNNSEISIDLNIYNYIRHLKQLINNIRQKNIKKTIIIFLNIKIFGDLLDEISEIILFKYYTSTIPNILIDEKVINVDIELLENNIRHNWPIEDITFDEIQNYIKDFTSELMLNEIIIYHYKKYIAYQIITKILEIDLKMNLFCNIAEIPNVYSEYIKAL